MRAWWDRLSNAQKAVLVLAGIGLVAVALSRQPGATDIDAINNPTTTVADPASSTTQAATTQAPEVSTSQPTTTSKPTTTEATNPYCVIDGSSMLINATCIHDDWPLSAEEGVLACHPAFAVTFAADGTEYAINGLARQRDEWAEVDPIWLDNPDVEGLKVNIGPLIDLGLTLCD